MKKENSKKNNYKIKCDVESCVHNNCKDNCCKLEEIKVSCSCCGDEVSSRDETICSSFKNIENE